MMVETGPGRHEADPWKLIQQRHRPEERTALLHRRDDGDRRDDGNDGGLLDGGLFEFSERADRVAAGLRDLDAADDDRNGLRVDGDGGERRLSVASRVDGGSCGLRNKRRLRKRLRRRLFERRGLFGRLRSLRRGVDDLRRNGV